VNSKVRNKYASHFQPDIDVRKCRYIWLGTHLKLNAFTFITEPSEWGWFQVHAYRSTATPAPSSSSAARKPGAPPGWTSSTRRAPSPLREALREASAGQQADEQRPPPARLGLDQLQSRVANAGTTGASC
jgi:hypothetical protein